MNRPARKLPRCFSDSNDNRASRGADALRFVVRIRTDRDLGGTRTTLAWVGSMSHVAWRRFAAYTPPSRDVGPGAECGPSRRPNEEHQELAPQDGRVCSPHWSAEPTRRLTEQPGNGCEVPIAQVPRPTGLGESFAASTRPSLGLGPVRRPPGRPFWAPDLPVASLELPGRRSPVRSPHPARRIPQWVAACFSA